MDTKIESPVLLLPGLYANTAKIKIFFDTQYGWQIRCYDAKGNKIGTLNPVVQ